MTKPTKRSQNETPPPKSLALVSGFVFNFSMKPSVNAKKHRPVTMSTSLTNAFPKLLRYLYGMIEMIDWVRFVGLLLCHDGMM